MKKTNDLTASEQGIINNLSLNDPSELGGFDEGIQAILPNRIYDIRHVGFNTVTALLAIAASLPFA